MIVQTKFWGVKIDDLKTTVNLFKHRDRGCDKIFGFLKKDDLLLLPIEGRVFNRSRAFDRFACVDAHLWITLHFLIFANLDPDIQIQLTKSLRILAEPDPQNWFFLTVAYTPPRRKTGIRVGEENMRIKKREGKRMWRGWSDRPETDWCWSNKPCHGQLLAGTVCAAFLSKNWKTTSNVVIA